MLFLSDEQLMFDRDKGFANTNVNEKVFILNKTTVNILSNFTPRETLIVDDKNPWFTRGKQCL